MIVKNVFRQIKSSFGRFFAIFAIVAIGVAFFAGVTASAGDMRHSSDCYYDEYNLFDLRLLSTVGFVDDDIDEISKADGVKGIYGTHSTDAVTTVDDYQSTIRVWGMLNSNLTADNDNYINRLRIKEGRLPENSGECVVKYTKTYDNKIKIGDVLTLKSGSEADISDSLANTEYKVVGIVYTPYYLSFDIGQTDVGSGNLNFCIMVQDNEFLMDYYTEAYVTVEGASELDTYSDEYFELVEKTGDNIKEIAADRFDVRAEEIKSELAKQKQEAIEQAKQQIKEAVYSQYEAQYKKLYPGIDVSSLIEPMASEAAQKQLEAFDSSEIDKAFEEAEAEALKNTGDWEWHILDRNSHYSFRDYKSSAERMDAIAAVFPMFFIIVAALVCLTTMTRMVDEQRELIGTYKALGYGKFSIALRYILYSLIASVLGGIAGCAVGLKLFPKIIYDSWNIMYDMPDITYADHTVLSVVATGSLVGVIVLATVYACYNDLSEVPSQLMRPKAPKKGKKILLERVGFIWKHLSFSSKVTCRNIFRYKKRFFMTVIGVAGGCALMMAGFGIKDSITALISKQFSELMRYDVSIMYTDSTSIDEISSDSRFEKFITVLNYTSDVDNTENVTDEDKERKEGVSVNVISEEADWQSFIMLRKRNTDITYDINTDGVFLTEKAANDLGVKKGDTVYAESYEGIKKPLIVAEVIEMYTGHYMYISEHYYKSVFDETVTDNCLFGILTDTDEGVEAQLGIDYLDKTGINAITFFSSNIKKFNDMIEALNLITYVLILSAAALSFVVLYNLTNVNISERIREVATIKVLGFYNGEVAMYVYRENIIISIIGALAGLGLGVILHGFIMKTVEMDNIMFGNVINLSSYIYAFLFTMLFSLIVNAVMYAKLKNIPMVESLKSVE